MAGRSRGRAKGNRPTPFAARQTLRGLHPRRSRVKLRARQPQPRAADNQAAKKGNWQMPNPCESGLDLLSPFAFKARRTGTAKRAQLGLTCEPR